MQCKLCLQEKLLIKKSHIIPDFMYEGLFDDKHRIAQKNFVINRDSLPANGVYDKHILCANCDNNIIGGYESYAARELFKPSMNGFIDTLKQKLDNFSGDITNVTISRINYQKAKLFLLSILWRANISTHPLFKFVNLDITTSEQIRQMLYSGLPCKSNLFEVSVAAFIPDGTRPYFSIGPPRMISFQGNQSYYAFYYNFLFISV